MNEEALLQTLELAARQVIDPETGLNVVDMGLIYEIEYSPDERKVHVVMTFTTPGCPSGGLMVRGLEWSLGAIDGVDAVDVEVVFEPRWNPDMISQEGRNQLGWM
jgi:metal-sulfur cluster biosynthetic enzyme